MLERNLYGGNILIVDLSTGKVQKEPTDDDLIEKFLGGEGFALALAERYLTPKIDPLSPDNVITIAPGALCGTMCVPSGKTTVVHKATMPARADGTCYVASARGGSSHLGIMIKNAGYDGLVIKGRAERPSYIEIIDDEIRILDAKEMWGRLNIFETDWELRNKYGTCGTITIGKAGENLVKWTMAGADSTGTLGRHGFGCVMGSKNLKAIVVKGSKGIKIADPERFLEKVNTIQKAVNECQPFTDMVRKLGYNAFWMIWQITLNQGNMDLHDYGYLNRNQMSEQHISDIKACTGCAYGCHMATEVKEGKYKGQKSPFGHLLLANMIMNRLSIDLNSSVKLLKDCSDTGLCAMTFMSMADWITRIYQDGKIPKGKYEIEFSRDLDTYIDLIQLIVNRKGLGNILADGYFAASEEFGVDVTKDTVIRGIAKGSDPIYDARFTTLDPLRWTYITNPRPQHAGAHSITTIPSFVPQFPITVEMVKENYCHQGIPKEELEKDFTPVPYYGAGYNVGRLAVENETSRNILNSLGGCSIYNTLTPWTKAGYIEDYAEIYSAAIGKEVTASDLRNTGERIFNLYKALNVKEGLERKDDWVEAWMHPRHTPEGTVELMDFWRTRVITRNDLHRLLDDYYEKRGWDVNRGIPTIEKLESIGLAKTARDFEEMGIF